MTDKEMKEFLKHMKKQWKKGKISKINLDPKMLDELKSYIDNGYMEFDKRGFKLTALGKLFEEVQGNA